MERNTVNASALPALYAGKLSALQTAAKKPEELFLLYNKENLTEPDTWYQALATLEYALDAGADGKEMITFLRLLSRGYDSNASVDLPDEDYDWLFHKTDELLGRLTAVDVEAQVARSFHHFRGRRTYQNKPLALTYLKQAVPDDEYATILLGYYLYSGILGESDKPRGVQMLQDARQGSQKFWADLYLAYIALMEKRIDEATAGVVALQPDPKSEREKNAVLELQGILAEMQGDLTEAIACFEQLGENGHNAFAFYRLGYMHLNGQVEGGKPEQGLEYLEKAFRFGRYDAADTLAYTYNPDMQKPWADMDTAIAWMERGYRYGEAYSAFELAQVYLYNEAYSNPERGVECLDYAVSADYENALIQKSYQYSVGQWVEKDMDKALGLLKHAVETGSGYAAYRIGTYYEDGELTEQPDYATALQWFLKSAELGHPYGYDLAGRSYRYGYTGEADVEKARECYEKAMELGSDFSTVELALMYEQGVGAEYDLSKAYELYQKAAANDYPMALYKLGLYEEYGYAGEPNPEKAYEYNKRAAEAGFVDAYFRLARCYQLGIGTEKNPDAMLEWLQKGVDEGDEACLTEMGLCYENATGVEENPAKAAEYIAAAAEKGYMFALYKLGNYYMYGYSPIEENHEVAKEWLEKAVAAGSPNAMIEMGDYYLYDYDSLGEYDKAFAYYKQASEQDCVTEGLGFCLFFGYGVEENEAEAFKYFLMAAERGYPRAMHRAGMSYYYGWGIKENKEEAFRWFNDAAQSGMSAAGYYLGMMLREGEGCTANEEEGMQWLQKSAENDYADAQFELGNCYLLGRGVAEDAERAMEWFEKAADNGHEQAQKVVGRRKRK